MKSTAIPTTALSFDSYKDTNNLRNPSTAEDNIVEVSAGALMVTKTVHELFIKLVNVVRIVQGIFGPYHELLAMNTRNRDYFNLNAAPGLKTCL